MSDQRSFERTGLWKRTLAPRSGDIDEQERARLRNAYEGLRRNVVQLAAEIHRRLPFLTLHDINHLDALWSTADLIAGSEYILTPAEGFVFGSAVLLHDAGHALAAVKGDLPVLKSTSEWRDAAVAALDRAEIIATDQLILEPPANLFEDILFAVLRSLHSRTAEQLAFMEITDSSTGERLRLLEDNSLRQHYGSLIGQIAASHNWDIEELSRLPNLVGAMGGLPFQWTIDPVMVACLLRCADAAQIDQQRAPDFLFALLKLRGISRDHWTAQNKLAQPVRDPVDPRAILYTSTGLYREEEADAWWVARDLVGVVNRELIACNSLMRDTRRKEFYATRVRDAEVVNRLRDHIRPTGWEPVEASLKVSDATGVASVLGGKELYGEILVIPIRELVQNAADAVRARRLFENDPDFAGRILVRLRKETKAEGDEIWLDVEDNGIGMSERVLIGPLLDFGTSFWTNKLVADEFPGLRGGRFNAAGRFGIGFYSVFMWADRVIVGSRRFDYGLEGGRTLVFKNGLASRPLLLKKLPPRLNVSTQTIVSIRVSPLHKNDFEKNFLTTAAYIPKDSRDREQTTGTAISLQKHINVLCPTLDCDVYTQEFDSPPQLAHTRRWYETDGKDWLISISLEPKKLSAMERQVLEQAAARLSVLYDGDRVVGRAAISKRAPAKKIAEPHFGHVAHGGLMSQTILLGKGTDSFVGVLEARPVHANRYDSRLIFSWDQSRLISNADVRKTWAKEQMEKLQRSRATASEIGNAVENFLRFGFIVQDKIMFYRVSRAHQYKKLGDVEKVSLSDLVPDNAAKYHLCFLCGDHDATHRGEIKHLSFFDRRQFEAIQQVLVGQNLDNVVLNALDGREWNRLPKAGEEISNACSIQVILQNLRERGFVAQYQVETLPHHLRLKKVFDGILKITAERNL